MSSIDDVAVVQHKGRTFNAVPYLTNGRISKFMIMKPGSDEVLHNVEGPWISEEMARMNIKARVMALIDSGAL